MYCSTEFGLDDTCVWQADSLSTFHIYIHAMTFPERLCGIELATTFTIASVAVCVCALPLRRISSDGLSRLAL